MFILRYLFCIAVMAVGASALAVLHAVGRDLSSGSIQRRHVPLVGRSGDTSPAPNLQARQLMAQRRSMRQKRCAPRVPGSGNNDAPSETASSSSVQATEVPANVAPAPTSSEVQENNVETPAPAPAPSDTNSAPSNGNSNSGGDTFTGELTYVPSFYFSTAIFTVADIILL
jgi:hypothetical protein